MLTVHDLVRELDLPVCAGEEGLELPVRWVHISELLDPTPWLSGGELLLSTGMLLDTPERQRSFVERLAEHQLAGLGIGTGFRHEAVPPAIIEAASERGFPVFEVPYDVPFIAITEAAFTRLVNEQYAVLRRAIAAHERLEQIVLSQRGLEALAAALASLLGASIVILDGRGEPRVHWTFRRALPDSALAELTRELRERAERREARPFVPAFALEGNRGLALPVSADGASRAGANLPAPVPEAWLVALKDTGPLSDFDRLTLRHAVTIVALELLRDRVAGETERRLAGDILLAMANGELAGAELARRLEPFGLGREAATIVAAQESSRDGSETLRAALEGALHEEAIPAVVAATPALTCAVVGGMPEEELFALAHRLSDRLAKALGAGVRVAAGRAVPSGEARRSFHEARCALEAASLGLAGGHNGSGAVATYQDLGSFQLLLSLQDDEALRLFCDSILGPIEASEGRYGGELMRSLEAFIECNGQWERAAKRLYCHRHTLRYRIRRVESLTGRSLQSARDRIEFWLALRGRELVSASRSEEVVQ